MEGKKAWMSIKGNEKAWEVMKIYLILDGKSWNVEGPLEGKDKTLLVL